MEDLENAFVDFVNKVPFYGASVLCLDEERVQDILPGYGAVTSPRLLPSGRDLRGGRVPRRLELAVSVEDCRGVRGRGQASYSGRVSVLNSLAAIGIGRELGLSFDEIRSGLESFSGVDRRFQVKADAAVFSSSTITATTRPRSARR